MTDPRSDGLCIPFALSSTVSWTVLPFDHSTMAYEFFFCFFLFFRPGLTFLTFRVILRSHRLNPGSRSLSSLRSSALSSATLSCTLCTLFLIHSQSHSTTPQSNSRTASATAQRPGQLLGTAWGVGSWTDG